MEIIRLFLSYVLFVFSFCLLTALFDFFLKSFIHLKGKAFKKIERSQRIFKLSLFGNFLLSSRNVLVYHASVNDALILRIRDITVVGTRSKTNVSSRFSEFVRITLLRYINEI